MRRLSNGIITFAGLLIIMTLVYRHHTKEIPLETHSNTRMDGPSRSFKDRLYSKDITHEPPGGISEDFSDVAQLIDPPAGKTTRYNFTHINNANPLSNSKPLLGQYGQLGQVADLFKGKQDGFFLECGALDGEYLSNTLLFELQMGWSGLLIEANPEAYAQLRQKQRKAHSINVALSKQQFATRVQFEVMRWNAISGTIEEDGLSARQRDGTRSPFKDAERSRVVTVEAFPLYAILSALGNPTVDYFSLDVEGLEEGVLETMPWEKVEIEVVQVEFTHSNKSNILRIMDAAGYDNPFNLLEDLIFVKRGKQFK